MQKKIIALLAALSLCLSSVPSALAAETRSVTVTVHELKPGYYMGAVWDGDTLLTLFDAEVDSSGTLNQVVEIGDTPIKGDSVSVAISNKNVESTGSKPIVLPNLPVRTGNQPDNPDKPDQPDKPDNPDNPGDTTTQYTVSHYTSGNGSLSVSPSSAKQGVTVTVSAFPDAGYRLSAIRADGTNGQQVKLSGSGTRYTFTMPASNVTVSASFVKTSSSSDPYVPPYNAPSVSDWPGAASSTTAPPRPVTQGVPQASAGGQIFLDIPGNHWAAGEIGWAFQNGYMNGTGGGYFTPNAAVSRRQLGTILARLLEGSRLTEDNLEAVRNGLANGRDPAGAVTRVEMVSALHRCALLMGRKTVAAGNLAAYADQSRVPSPARNAMSWAVGCGIISGDSGGKLNPNGTVTRAQFAVFLYRFSQRV